MRQDVRVRIPTDYYVTKRWSPVTVTALREHAERRLQFALRRFEDQVRAVSVRLVDQNGPKGGVDTRCVMSAELRNGQPIVVEATAAWPKASVTEAAKRLNQAIRRRIDRNHRSRRNSSRLEPALQPALAT